MSNSGGQHLHSLFLFFSFNYPFFSPFLHPPSSLPPLPKCRLLLCDGNTSDHSVCVCRWLSEWLVIFKIWIYMHSWWLYEKLKGKDVCLCVSLCVWVRVCVNSYLRGKLGQEHGLILHMTWGSSNRRRQGSAFGSSVVVRPRFCWQLDRCARLRVFGALLSGNLAAVRFPTNWSCQGNLQKWENAPDSFRAPRNYLTHCASAGFVNLINWFVLDLFIFLFLRVISNVFCGAVFEGSRFTF